MLRPVVRAEKRSPSLSWEQSFEEKLARTVDTLISQTTKHIGLVQKRTLQRRTHKEEIIAEALRLVARELYGRPVTVKLPKTSKNKPLRFIVTCQRGEQTLEVFPIRLAP